MAQVKRNIKHKTSNFIFFSNKSSDIHSILDEIVVYCIWN